MAKANETSPATNDFMLASPSDADWTHHYAEVQLPPACVVRRFGKGIEGDGYKVSRQWVFRKGELVFTLYDWKSTYLYDVELWHPNELWASEWPFDLHVGSKSPATPADVQAFIEFLERAVFARA